MTTINTTPLYRPERAFEVQEDTGFYLFNNIWCVYFHCVSLRVYGVFSSLLFLYEKVNSALHGFRKNKNNNNRSLEKKDSALSSLCNIILINFMLLINHFLFFVFFLNLDEKEHRKVVEHFSVRIGRNCPPDQGLSTRVKFDNPMPSFYRLYVYRTLPLICIFLFN